MTGDVRAASCPSRHKIRDFLPSVTIYDRLSNPPDDSVCWETARVLGETRCTRIMYLNWLSRFLENRMSPEHIRLEGGGLWNHLWFRDSCGAATPLDSSSSPFITWKLWYYLYIQNHVIFQCNLQRKSWGFRWKIHDFWFDHLQVMYELDILSFWSTHVGYSTAKYGLQTPSGSGRTRNYISDWKRRFTWSFH